MSLYQKKPVVIEAVEWTGKNHREMWDFLTGLTEAGMKPSGPNFYIDHDKVQGGLVIRTLEGEHIASIGDFIIKGVYGEFYPCKPDIFAATYEKVDLEAYISYSGEKMGRVFEVCVDQDNSTGTEVLWVNTPFSNLKKGDIMHIIDMGERVHDTDGNTVWVVASIEHMSEGYIEVKSAE